MVESEQTRDLCERLKSLGAKILPIVANVRMPTGWPDRFLSHYLVPGGAWIEFKGHHTPLDPLQRTRLVDLGERRCLAVTCRFEKAGSLYVWCPGAGCAVRLDNDAKKLLNVLRWMGKRVLDARTHDQKFETWVDETVSFYDVAE